MKFLLIMQVNPAALEALTETERNAIGDGPRGVHEDHPESGEFIGTQALADPATRSPCAAPAACPR